MVDATTKYINIPMPRATANLYRGVVGAQTEVTNPVSVRWTDGDRRYIERQAGTIGLTFSEFVRWCAVYGAKEINKLQMQEDFKIITKQRQPIDTDGFE
jgi:hypothetical protein